MLSNRSALCVSIKNVEDDIKNVKDDIKKTQGTQDKIKDSQILMMLMQKEESLMKKEESLRNDLRSLRADLRNLQAGSSFIDTKFVYLLFYVGIWISHDNESINYVFLPYNHTMKEYINTRFSGQAICMSGTVQLSNEQLLSEVCELETSASCPLHIRTTIGKQTYFVMLR